jgi:hypothetical protein
MKLACLIVPLDGCVVRFCAEWTIILVRIMSTVEAASSYTEPTGKPLSRRPGAKSSKKLSLLQVDKRPCESALSPKPFLRSRTGEKTSI